jgi:K+-transporting ATPase KdpF subunit
MTVWPWVALVLAVLIAVYVVIALLKAEDFA